MIDSGVRVAVIGGCGHVGLPLGLCLASEAHHVSAVDVDAVAVDWVNSGRMPFEEAGALPILESSLSSGHFLATTDASAVSHAETVIVVVGTPVDETLTPDPESIVSILSEYRPHLRDGQLLILRSTVYPGVTRRVEAFLEDSGWVGDVAFCPERILEGHAIREIRTLPQIVGARTPQALKRASDLFVSLGVRCLESTPEEAELAKLFSNMWRYIKFAAANEFWLVANEAGQDYVRIRELMSTDYPRAADVPGAGFAAGPCLYKDTIQVSTYMSGRLPIGLAATTTNEDLPLYIVNRLARKFDLARMNVAILGMAFKANSDDTRASLSYKLKRLLRFHARKVLTSDPLVKTDTELVPLEEALMAADLVIIGVPHDDYRDLQLQVPFVDIWNVLGKGSQL